MKTKEIDEKKPFFVEGIDINAPQDFVFKFIGDYNKRGLWVEGLKEEIHEDAEGVVGSTFKEKIKMYGHESDYAGKILAYEEGKMYQIQIGDKWVDFKIEYDLEEASPGKTHLTQCVWTLKGTSFYKLFNVINRHIFHKQLDKLKEAVEKDYLVEKN